MKNTLKKVSAIAMAFTLLTAGTTVTKNFFPQFNSSLTASAIVIHTPNEDYITSHSYPGGSYGYGSYGNGVYWIQQAIKTVNYYTYFLGYSNYYFSVDSSYGPKTREAVIKLQKYLAQQVNTYGWNWGVSAPVADGVYGPKTHAALCAYMNSQYYDGKRIIR